MYIAKVLLHHLNKLEYHSHVLKTFFLNGMSSTFNVGRPPERPIFLIISSIFSEITNQFDLEVDGHLFYRAQ